jgi:spore germination protein GerM
MAGKKDIRISKSALLLGGLAFVLLALVIVFFAGRTGERVKHTSDDGPARPPDAAQAEAAVRKVTLFFLSDEDDLLHEETREIAAGPTAAEEAERALAELIRGSERGFLSPLPPETKVRQVFVGKDGLATADFSREIAEKFAYGSSSELEAVYAVVDTLVYNFRQIKRVAILVEGAERDTLGGHVDLSRAFFPDYSLIAR